MPASAAHARRSVLRLLLRQNDEIIVAGADRAGPGGEKEQFRALESQASERHLERLKSGRPESIETSALHLDILRDLKRINSHLSYVAYPILDSKGELRHSRLKASSGRRPAPTVGEAASDAIKPARPGAR